jgi:hypothetical protein
MCPACLTTAALLATGATSAGGLIGFLAVKLRTKGSESADTIGLAGEAREDPSLSERGAERAEH